MLCLVSKDTRLKGIVMSDMTTIDLFVGLILVLGIATLMYDVGDL